MEDASKGRDLPIGGAIDADLPVRPAMGGYGASDQDIARGYRPIPYTDTDARTGPYPAAPPGKPEVLIRDDKGDA